MKGNFRSVFRYSIPILVQFTLAISLANASGNKKTVQYQSAHIHGNITLGGLFPIHSQNKKGNCSIINGVLGIQRLEAMLFAIQRINKDDSILPEITLGMNAYDTCASETIALDRTVEGFITDPKCDSKQEEAVIGGRQVVGVVGPLYSSVSVQVAHLLRLFQMPQISYDSTSSELSDRTKYEYFLRTVPSDFLQARAIIAILKHFGWSYVSAVYSDDNYGRKGIEALTSEADKHGICIAVKEMIPYPSDSKTFTTIIRKLHAEKQARVVVVFCSKKETIKRLLHEADTQKVVNTFQWIGSDAWITVSWLEELQPLVHGLISVQPHSKPIKEFQEYLFRRVPSRKDTTNPWFLNFYRETVKCRLLSDKEQADYSICNENHTLRTANMTIDSGVSRTIAAVYAFAHALHEIQGRKCTLGVICPKMKETSGKEVLSTLKRIKFKNINGELMGFKENGDTHARYDIYFFNKTETGTYENVLIGEWRENLTMYPTIKAAFKPRNSFCGIPCKENEVKRLVDGQSSCCWECVTCTGNKFAFNRTHCRECPRGYWPNNDKQRCEELPPRYFTVDKDVVDLHLVLPPLLVSILGIISVLFVVVIFIKYNETPLVKASGRELSFLLLTGLFLCYSVLFFCILRPSSYICLLEFILDSLPFTICYAAVIVKTNRISRIFNRRNLTKRPQFIHPQSQICFALSLVAVQVMLLTAFCILQLPRAELVYLSVSDVVLICAISDKDFLLSQIYNFVLIIICTYYAFKTRRSPMNFNEAKYIAFAMYCTCVLWLAFITVYLVQTDVMLKSCIRCLSVSLIATILLVCLFVPKVYIIICKPSENRKRPTLPSHSISSLNGEQGPSRPVSAPYNNISKARDWRQNGRGDQNDGTFRRGTYRPRSSTDPRRFDNDRKSWRYSLPPEQFSRPSEPTRKLDKEEEMEMEMRSLIERLSILESLLNQQQQASGSYQTLEIQGALKSCQGLIAEVKKHNTCSIPECLEENNCEENVFLCPTTENTPKKPDNRSLVMTYAQTPTCAGSQIPKQPKTKNICKQHKRSNGSGISSPSVSGAGRNTTLKVDNEKIGLLQYPMSPLKNTSTSDAIE